MSTRVHSPGTALTPLTIEDLLTANKYYDRRGINEEEYKLAIEQIKPNKAPISHIFKAYENPTTGKVKWSLDKDTGRQGYAYNDKGELIVTQVDRLSEAVYPVVNAEMYKFVDDVLSEVDKLVKEENVKSANPVHILKALMLTGYFPIIEDYLDYYSTYQGYDFDLETAKLEL